MPLNPVLNLHPSSPEQTILLTSSGQIHKELKQDAQQQKSERVIQPGTVKCPYSASPEASTGFRWVYADFFRYTPAVLPLPLRQYTCRSLSEVGHSSVMRSLN